MSSRRGGSDFLLFSPSLAVSRSTQPRIPSKTSDTQSATLFSRLSLSAPFGDPAPQKSKALTGHAGSPVHLSVGERKSPAFLPGLQEQKFPPASLIRPTTDFLSPVVLIQWVTLYPPCSGPWTKGELPGRKCIASDWASARIYGH